MSQLPELIALNSREVDMHWAPIVGRARDIKRLLIVTDAWYPQVNGVVRTLENTRAHLQAQGIEVEMLTPDAFRTIACPSYSEIRLSLTTAKKVARIIERIAPDSLHIATEGPLGWMARRAAIKRGWKFTTAYHTRFPEYVHARVRIPKSWTYRVFRRFHSASSAVLAPTHAIMQALKDRRFERLSFWTRGVDHEIFYPHPRLVAADPENPIFLFAGRVAVEKNIEAFLQLDLPGQKWVVGDGPMLTDLKRKYPGVRFFGVLSQRELANVYSQADVFVFPSLTDTFGLVLVEAMACGLPVAAFPVAGPIDVVGQSKAGVLSNDLRQACLDCLTIDRNLALEHARKFSWEAATEQFAASMQPMQRHEIYFGATH